MYVIMGTQLQDQEAKGMLKNYRRMGASKKVDVPAAANSLIRVTWLPCKYICGSPASITRYPIQYPRDDAINHYFIIRGIPGTGRYILTHYPCSIDSSSDRLDRWWVRFGPQRSIST